MAVENSRTEEISEVRCDAALPRRILLTRALPLSVAAMATLALPIGPVSDAAAATGGNTDAKILQTAAGLEALLLSLYQGMLALPVLTGASSLPALVQLFTVVSGHHGEHLQAVQEAASRLGTPASPVPDPRYQPIVNAALSAAEQSSGPASLTPVLRVAASLENVSAASYVSQVRLVRNSGMQRLAASTSGVEAQHESSLLLLQSLAASGDLSEFTIGPGAAALPTAAIQAGVPESVYPSVGALPQSAGTRS